MKTRTFILAVCCAVAAISLTSCKGGGKKVATATFENPVIRRDCPDPSVLDNRIRDGWFYCYSTGGRILPMYRSRDIVSWEPLGNAFGGNVRPTWDPGSIWAPDCSYINGKYVLYYALGHARAPINSVCGAAWSDKPEGPYTDNGLLVDYKTTGVGSSIDANYFEDEDGRKYLFWGSFQVGDYKAGIHVVELNDDGMTIKDPSKVVFIGADNMEGSYVYKRKGWYYLFTSKGSCCDGANSTYNIVVSRSRNVLGPYTGPDGTPLTDHDYANTILHGTDDGVFVGPGHNGEIITDDNGQDWMPYHVYWKGNDYKGRCMNIDKIFWGKDGWPYFKDGVPQASSDAPYFKD